MDRLENIEYDLYFILGLDDDASPEQIQEAYEKLADLMQNDENLKYDEDASREASLLFLMDHSRVDFYRFVSFSFAV